MAVTMPEDVIVHERTLLGAVDSYLGHLVHVRPYLAPHYRAGLEAMADDWLEDGHPNWLTAIDSQWLAQWRATMPGAEKAIDDFFAWTVRAGLVDVNPLA